MVAARRVLLSSVFNCLRLCARMLTIEEAGSLLRTTALVLSRVYPQVERGEIKADELETKEDRVAFFDQLSLLFVAEKDHDAAAVSVEIREGELHAIVCTEDYPTVALPASTDVITARNEPYVETRGKASASFQPLRAEDTAGYSSIEHQAVTGARVGDAVGKHL
jgi:hypothetical protein